MSEGAGLATGAMLRGAREGDKLAKDSLFALAYDELRRIAHRVKAGRAETLSTTALVHEAYLKLLPGNIPAADAVHFKRLIARAMRDVMVDAARRSGALKRGGADLVVTLDDGVEDFTVKSAAVLELDAALDTLARVDERRAAVVECRFFGGLDVDETATALGLSTATVKRDWRVARAWLARALKPVQ